MTAGSRLLALLVLTAAPWAVAVAGPLHHGKSSPGRPRSFEHTDARAGDPRCVCRHAIPTNGPAYGGYHVGGGSACGGCARRAEEGTWGWDYQGVLFRRRVQLSWSHGRRVQGGTGSYRTD